MGTVECHWRRRDSCLEGCVEFIDGRMEFFVALNTTEFSLLQSEIRTFFSILGWSIVVQLAWTRHRTHTLWSLLQRGSCVPLYYTWGTAQHSTASHSKYTCLLPLPLCNECILPCICSNPDTTALHFNQIHMPMNHARCATPSPRTI